MLIYLNNQPITIDDFNNSIENILLDLKLPVSGIGIGVNNKLIKSKDWPSFRVKAGDRITIIKAAYGG